MCDPVEKYSNLFIFAGWSAPGQLHCYYFHYIWITSAERKRESYDPDFNLSDLTQSTHLTSGRYCGSIENEYELASF